MKATGQRTIESGAASMIIELKGGAIRVYHAQTGVLTNERLNVPGGTWERLQRFLVHSLDIAPVATDAEIEQEIREALGITASGERKQ